MKHKLLPIFAATWFVVSQIATANISPEAQELIDRYVEVTGGIEAKQSVHSLIQYGKWEMPEQGISGPMTVYFKTPGRMASVTEIPDIGSVRACVVDGTAWEDNSITGFRSLDGTELQQALNDASIFPEIQLSKNYASASVNEERSDGLIPVVLIDNNGFEETWFFDPITSYLSEIHRVLDAGVRGSYRVKMVLGNYQQVGDLVMPHYTETSTPAFKIVALTEKIEFNAEIPDYLFIKPEGK